MLGTKAPLAGAHAEAPDQTNLTRGLRALQGVKVGAAQAFATTNHGLGRWGRHRRLAQRGQSLLGAACRFEFSGKSAFRRGAAQPVGHLLGRPTPVTDGGVCAQHFTAVTGTRHHQPWQVLPGQACGIGREAVVQGQVAHTVLLHCAINVLGGDQQPLGRRLNGCHRPAGAVRHARAQQPGTITSGLDHVGPRAQAIHQSHGVPERGAKRLPTLQHGHGRVACRSQLRGYR